QKDVARVHEIDRSLLEGMWNQFDAKGVSKTGLVLSTDKDARMPNLPLFFRRSRRADFSRDDLRTGFTLDLWAQTDSPGQILVDNRTADGRGFALITVPGDAVELILNDGRTESRWRSDPGLITAGKLHHIVAIIDGGPKIISFVIDGMFN